MMKSGEFQRLYDKWFTTPIPPKNVNLNFPMAPPLKEAIANPNDRGV
jgi:glutamate/aspartate transport system substrate-binding protein